MPASSPEFNPHDTFSVDLLRESFESVVVWV